IPSPAANKMLDEHGLGAAPHNQLAGRTHLWIKCDDLLVFLANRAVIEANHHAAIMNVSPTFHKNEVCDFECQTFRKMRRRGGNAAPRQIVHNSVQFEIKVAVIVDLVKYMAVKIHRSAWAANSSGR